MDKNELPLVGHVLFVLPFSYYYYYNYVMVYGLYLFKCLCYVTRGEGRYFCPINVTIRTFSFIPFRLCDYAFINK